MKSITATVWLLSDDTWMTEIHEQESVHRETSEIMPRFFFFLILSDSNADGFEEFSSFVLKKKKEKEAELQEQ